MISDIAYELSKKLDELEREDSNSLTKEQNHELEIIRSALCELHRISTIEH